MSDLPFDTRLVEDRPVAAAPHDHASRAAPLLVGPAVALMLVLLIGPVVAVAVMSLTDYQLGAPSFAFVGFDNYRELLADKVF